MSTPKEKQRRMELRKGIGNRIITPPNPPPYHRGAPYLVPHACFSCRKSFRLSVDSGDAEKVCPECSGTLYEMGRNFRAPKKSDAQQWKKVKRLYEAGFRFIGSGAHDVPRLPEKLSDVESFLEENPRHPLKVATPCVIKGAK